MSIKSEDTNLSSSASTEAIAAAEVKQPSISDEPFYFESDSLALRGNPDYSCLLKTLVLLELQRAKAIQDLEKLVELKEKALENPFEFVSNLSQGDKNKNYPTRQSVYLLPEIDWNKYYECVNLTNEEFERSEGLLKASLRKRSNQQMSMDQLENLKLTNRLSKQQQSLSQGDETKPKAANYNRPWDIEEQRKFEELLIEFPPEDNEAARWRKIAQKLGTRTPLQVQSHCQKYFIKLAKAGLPVPGRMPNLKTYGTKKGSRGGGGGGGVRKGGPGRSSHTSSSTAQKRMIGRGVSLENISSMWNSFNPPVSMNDEDDQMCVEENRYDSMHQYQNDQFNDAYQTDESENNVDDEDYVDEFNGSQNNIS